MSATSQVTLADGLSGARCRMAFLSEVVLAIAEKPAMSCPLSGEAWHGFFLFTQDLDGHLQELAELAGSLCKQP